MSCASAASAGPASSARRAACASAATWRNVRRQRLRSRGDTCRSPPMYAPERASDHELVHLHPAPARGQAAPPRRASGGSSSAGSSSPSMRSRNCAVPRQYRFHSAFCSARFVQRGQLGEKLLAVHPARRHVMLARPLSPGRCFDSASPRYQGCTAGSCSRACSSGVIARVSLAVTPYRSAIASWVIPASAAR